MKLSAISSATADMSLEEVIARLAAQQRVEGIVLVGSTATRSFTPASDIDVVVVLSSDGGPARAGAAPFEVVFTWIENRPADVIITTIDELDAESDLKEPVPHPRESLLRWVSEGRVVYDRDGRVGSVVRRTRATEPRPWTDAEQRTLWWTANFALVKARRYAAKEDRQLQSVRWIVNQGFHAALVGYFAARRLPWRGEEDAIRYWKQHDERFLRAAFDLFDADDRDVIDLYSRVVEAALEPIGGIWPDRSGPLSETWQSLIEDTESKESL